MWDFMREHVFPAEPVYEEWRASRGHDDHGTPPVLEELKAEARKRGLWNLFHHELAGLSNLEYASIAEITGWSPVIAPEAINCGAPDTGNMETLMLFGTPEQKERWLNPLLEGEIRSAFAMTEPDVASSDARNIQTSIVRDGDDYVINGRKWWITGAADERCQIFIVMGKTDPDGSPHRQQSMVLVPRDTPGVEIVRHLPVFGYQDQHGHSELRFTDVRVPAGEHPGRRGRRLHDRAGAARARAASTTACAPSAWPSGPWRSWSSAPSPASPSAGRWPSRAPCARRSRCPASRSTRRACYVLKTADLIDKYGAKGARTEISAIKVAAPKVRPRRHRPRDPAARRRRRQRRHPAGRASTRTPARCGSSTARTRCTSAAVAKEELDRERPYSA